MHFTLSVSPVFAQPTLARLSFYVPPGRMSGFQSAYRAKVAPILKRHGLTESSERGRATPDSVFSVLFELRRPSEVGEKQKALDGDPAWRTALQTLGTAFASAGGGLIRHEFMPYAAPAGPGRSVPAGPGRRVAAGKGRGSWRTYDTTDGLPNVNINAILQDRDEVLWFATPGGLIRFNGRYFATFTVEDGLGSNVVTSALLDREGDLWVGTRRGLSRCPRLTLQSMISETGARDTRKRGKVFKTFTVEDGLADNEVTSVIMGRGGDLWVGTRRGLSRCPASTLKSMVSGTGAGGARHRPGDFVSFTVEDGLRNEEVLSLFQDRDGDLWIGTRRGLVRQVLSSSGQGTAPAPFRTFAFWDSPEDNRVSALCQDRDGALWVGTNGGLVRFDPKAGDRRAHSASSGQAWTTFTVKDGLTSNEVISLFQDRDADLWAGTLGGGVVRISKDRRARPVFVPFTSLEGLAGNTVRAILQDREGFVWLGTTSGISRYGGEVFTTFTVKDGLASNDVISVFQDRQGDLWFGMRGAGVSRYDGQTFTTFSTRDGLAGGYVQTILQDRRGDLWFGSRDGGATRYDGRTFTAFTPEDGFAWAGVLSALQDREGNLWFGTKDGATRYDGRMCMTYTPADGLAHPTVRAIAEDREGRIWFGTWGGGISRLDGETFVNFREGSDPDSNMVWSALADREGRLWFGTWGAGLRRYDPSTPGLRSGQAPSTPLRAGGGRFSNLTMADGLATNYLMWGALQDRQGHFWFATDGGGANRYDGTAFQVLTIQDGLSGNMVSSIYQDRDGNLWCSTDGGVTRFRPPAPAPPAVVVDAVVADQRYERVSTQEIPSTVRLTIFEFSAISFKTRPEQMVYRYRLKGYDPDWRTTRERRVEYPGLPRGEYTFEVAAVDRDLVYSTHPATVTLRVRMPYERIGWVSALGVALALAAWQTTRVVRRDRRLREANAALSAANKELFSVNRQVEASNEDLKEARQQADRASQAKSVFLSHMSHEIRTPMTAILGYAQILRGDPALSARHRRAVEIVEVSGTHLLSLINDILDLSRIEAGREALNPVDFDLMALAEELSAMFRLRCEQKGLGWRVEMEGEQRPVNGDRHKLSQVLINLLGNAVKFTDGGGVTLRITAPTPASAQPVAPACAANGAAGRPMRSRPLSSVNGEGANVSPTAGEEVLPPSTGGTRGGIPLYLFEVIDTGPGISPEQQAEIFEPFEQGGSGALKGGTGLGLTIARRHVALMGSELGLKSEPGRGSTFSFTLPLPPAHDARRVGREDQWERVARLAPGCAVEALVVDDVPESREVLAEMLGRIGVVVRVAGGGPEALEALRERMPDIVFMDIRMPGMDGVGAMRRIAQRPEWAGVKVAAVSASVLTHERERYLSAGFHAFLDKPIRAGRLYACLSDLLGATFECEEVTPADAPPPDPGGRVELPDGLARRLRRAAEQYQVTELRRCLREVEALGPEGSLAAERLRALVERVDMEGVMRLLGKE